MSNLVMLGVVLASYIAILLGVGYWGYKRTKATAEDYYLAGRGLGTIVLAGTTIATYASMWTFMGAVGSNYRVGISFASKMMMWNILWPLLVWVIGTRVWILGKKYNYVTYSELINDYYDSKWLGIIGAIFGILSLLPYIAVQLMGGGLALESYTNGAIPYSLGVTVMFILMVLLIAVAGVKSVVITDTIQGIFFLSVMTGSALYAVHLAGGFGNMFSHLSSKNPDLLIPGKEPFGIWIGYVLTWGIAVLLPHMFQRLMMAKDPRTLGKVAKASSILSGWVQTIPVFILGIAIAVLIPNLPTKQTDSATVIFATKFMSDFFAALIVGGAFAAGTSTLNSQLLTSSSLVLRDLINPVKRISKEREVFYGRIIVVILGIIVLAIALARPGLIVPISTAGTAICISSYLYPLVGIIFWPRAGKVAAYSSMLVAGISAILTWVVWKYPLGLYNVLWGIILGGIAFFIASLLEKPPSKEKLEKYYELVKY